MSHFPTRLVLAAGIGLRWALFLYLAPEQAYDDHFQPIAIILRHQRLPRAEECWECYQPPLYYVLGSLSAVGAQGLSQAAGVSPDEAERVARKTVQLISVLAGCATLWVCLLVLRESRRGQARSGPGLSAWEEALALGVVAFLPQHVYMSAMMTNDALTYLLASLAILAAIRAHRRAWPIPLGLLTGALAGAAVLTKVYGWATVAALLAALPLAGVYRLGQVRRRREAGPPPGPTTSAPVVPPGAQPAPGRWGDAPRAASVAVDASVWRGAALVLVAALAVGIWPALGNLRRYGRPHVDNFEFFRGPMLEQPPGAREKVRFADLRLGALLHHPWVHAEHVDSFWTQIYGRLWFDYEGLATCLARYEPFRRHWFASEGPGRTRDRAFWDRLLSYGPQDVPPGLAWTARVSYLAGLPLTMALLAGWALALRSMGRAFATTLLALHVPLCLAVPLVQTLRLPVFAAMKTAFALSAVASLPFLTGLLLVTLPRRWRAPTGAVLAGCCAAVAATDAGYLLLLPR